MSILNFQLSGYAFAGRPIIFISPFELLVIILVIILPQNDHFFDDLTF